MNKKDIENKENEILNIETTHKGIVECIAKLYESQGLSHEELISAGNSGLLVAAERFQPNEKYSFIAYATWWIRHYILQAIQEKKN